MPTDAVSANEMVTVEMERYAVIEAIGALKRECVRLTHAYRNVNESPSARAVCRAEAISLARVIEVMGRAI